MSLLTNPWFNVGMGLLANSGPSLTPVNPWRGIGQGLMAANEAKVMEAEQQYRQQLMARQQQEYEQEAKRREMMQQWAQTQKDPALAALFPQQAAEAALRAPEGPNLPAGWMMGSDGQAMMIPGYTPEQTDDRPGTQKLYEEAVKQGYKGSLVDFINMKESAAAPKIDMGGTDRVSPSEASSMVYSDGSPVPPGELWEVARAKGARMLSKEEQAAQTQRGTQTEKDAAASEKGGNLFTNYVEAAKAYKSGMLPYGTADEQAKRARQALVTWYAKNVLGTPGAEPSPSLYDKAEQIIPDYGGPWDAAMFNARMTEIQQTIDAALGAKPKQGGDMTDVTLVYNPKTKRLEPAK